MILRPVTPRGSLPAAPGDRIRTAGLRRVLLLLAIALTVMAGPLGRPTADVAYALVRGHMGTGIKIDNLHYGPSAQTTTDTSGHLRWWGCG